MYPLPTSPRVQTRDQGLPSNEVVGGVDVGGSLRTSGCACSFAAFVSRASTRARSSVISRSEPGGGGTASGAALAEGTAGGGASGVRGTAEDDAGAGTSR